jgi:hypothetical protein
LLIEKMAERAVSDVVKESSQPEELLHIREGRKFSFKDLEERRVNLLGESPRDVHSSKGVLKTSMLGRRKYPASALKLEDATKALNPGRVD